MTEVSPIMPKAASLWDEPMLSKDLSSIHAAQLGDNKWAEELYSIFLVEDDLDDQLYSKRLLEASGSVKDVKCFSNGQEVITYLRENEITAQTPCAIIIDLNMPKMNGYELITRIKSNPMLEGIPIVVVTGALSYEAFRKVMEMKVDAVFRKPMNLEKLESFFKRSWQEQRRPEL